MLTISNPLSASQAQAYHAEEFGNARENYYTEADQIRGEWHGRLAKQWGLDGEVSEEHFQRLTEGRHPISGKQLVRHKAAREYVNESGQKTRTMEHRAAWDATFSAPKSVSLTALVGGDERLREAHEKSVAVALDELERYVQARIGGNLPAETTGKWAAAQFEHDSARPVDGYAAPQLHTHAVFFNLTETEEVTMRVLSQVGGKCLRLPVTRYSACAVCAHSRNMLSSGSAHTCKRVVGRTQKPFSRIARRVLDMISSDRLNRGRLMTSSYSA